MLGDRSCFVSGFVVVLAVAGCGGRQAPAVSPCEDRYNSMMAKGDDALCDTLQMNLFEIDVNKWKQDCPAEAAGLQGPNADEKLEKARGCSEKSRRTEILQNECKSRLAKAWTESDTCIGELCAPFSAEVDNLVETCKAAELGEDFADETGSLKANLDERMKDVERLTALAGLAALADECKASADAKQAAAAVDKILQAVTESTFVKESPQIGSEAERFRQRATTALDAALENALGQLLAGFGVILDNPKIKHTSRKWKRELGKLTALRTRFQVNDGATLFPASNVLLETAVAKYVPEEKAAPTETASAAAATAETVPPKPKTPAQCKALQKKAAQFTAKVAEYQQKEDPGKLKAYQAKLDSANQDLASCGEAPPPAEAAAAPPVENSAPAESSKPEEKTTTVSSN